jgi:hypothetical protein
MDFIEQNTGSVAEALENAHECWLAYYMEIQRTRPTTISLQWKGSRILFANMVWGAGSTINLFPKTHYEADYFRCWRFSLSDSWVDDWFNVGGDLYQALSKAEVELNGRPPEYESSIATTR